eukprot:CAMPEP_0117428480 /NCGR_PEP_ID=MMETSP0758-20121206/8176_1 /TAXON_ID=63605 /ORGANISM="Percolomonas cosmopolitus, Strain AE-1 (ATCC 50343)" /LENGTH=134 /DNA_ID=CAMNT_0005214855 /DNA_START=481 /DNA_END=882 /DNA_ORIENTATION=+
MSNEVRESLNNIFVTLEYFQLSKVTLPPRYDKAIEDKEITVQLETQATFEQKKKVTAADTAIFTARELSRKTIAVAQASKNLKYFSAFSQAETLKVITSADTTAYGALNTKVNINHHIMLNLMWQHTLLDHSGT